METLMDNEGFDKWAKDYDDAVIRNCHKYPFDKYYEGLYKIFKKIKASSTVLDIGFGTATLTKRLYDINCDIYGIDFSKEMIKIAREKMPNSKLFEYDFNDGLPKEISKNKFDYIISTYAMHHFTDEKKIAFINNLQRYLNKNGKIYILDIAFTNVKELLECKKNNSEDWDSSEYYIVWDQLKEHLSEYYIVWDQLKEHLSAFKYEQYSSCSGYIQLKK